MLKADVWRDHLLKEQANLDAKLAELESAGDDKRFEDEREELSSRLAEVHARLTEMDAESGPSRAAALLAGEPYPVLVYYLLLMSLQASVLTKLINSDQQNHSVAVGGKSHLA